MKKRGQITLFIIVGIVMLVSILLFIHFKTEVMKPEPPLSEIKTDPLQNFVTGCVDKLAMEAIERIGEQAGYVEIPESVRSNRNSFLSLFGFGDAIIPYWWYKGTSAIPPLDYMEGEIAKYVEDNLKICTSSFAPLRSQFHIEEEGKVEAVAKLNEGDVSVKVRYPLKVVDLLNNTEQRVETFEAIVPVRLKKVYEFAKDIIDEENRGKFLEKKTIDLMVLDPKTPDTDVEVTCEKRQWLLPEIQKSLKGMIAKNFQYIKIVNGEFYDGTYVESPNGIYYNESYFSYHYAWNVSEKAYPGVHATVSYIENWPFYIYARPSRNGVLKSNSQNGFDMLSGFCLHIWHFTYDIVFPVVVTLYDEETEHNREFRFQFATDVSVKSNQPVRENFASTVFEFSDGGFEDEYCSSPRNVVTVYTYDKVTNEPAPNINLTLVCGGFRCPVGKSEILGYGAAAGVMKKMPYCVSAFIKGAGDGYLPAQKNIQTSLKDKAYELEMTPVKEFKNIEIRKVLNGAESSMATAERGFISIKGPDNFEESVAYPLFGETALKLLAKSEFTYNITIYVMNEQSILGGYEATWAPSWDSMKGASKVVFYAAISPSNDEKERYKFVANLEENSKNVKVPMFS